MNDELEDSKLISRSGYKKDKILTVSRPNNFHRPTNNWGFFLNYSIFDIQLILLLIVLFLFMQVVLYGLGKQAELAYYYFTHDSSYEVVAFCAESAYLQDKSSFLGLPTVSFEALSAQYPVAEYKLHIAVGQIGARRRLFEAAKVLGYSFATYISSRAQTWPDLLVGENVFIDERTTTHPYVTIGDNVLLIGTQIGHHSQVGSHTLLSSCTLGGSVTIGESSFIGMGSIINEGLHIGANNIIGSGCLINKHTKDNAIYSGSYTKPRKVDATRFNLFS